MKKLLIFLMILFCVMPLMGCSKDDTSSQVIRIHIRANSNSNVDQDIKLVVRDEILKYVTPLIAKCKDSSDVKNVLTNNALKIDKIANSVLEQNGFDYTAKSKITNEYFPSRSYNGKIFKSDYYDALIVNLGTGSGNNWWCVAYPPLCFVGEDNGTNNVCYKSKLYELINNFFGR